MNFHPDNEFLSYVNSTKADPLHNIKTFHNELQAALLSFKDACNDNVNITWDKLPYAGKTWKAKMKFAIAYIIGDIVLHDQLCGRYGSRGE